MNTFELETKLANLKINTERLEAQLGDESLSDADWDLLHASAIANEQEQSSIRAQLAILKNAEIVAAKIA